MEYDIEERVRRSGEYIVQTGCTGKSTVHKDVTYRLRLLDADLAARVKHVLEVNLSERHLRGGASTKKKYALRRLDRSVPPL